MSIDSVTIMICIVLLLIALLSCFFDTFFRAIPKKGKRTTENFPLTVIVVAENNAIELRENLPSILSQDYPAGFEVIVAIAKDEDGTQDYLKSLSSYENLHTCQVPDSALYMSRRKLAITLGVKASKNDWILLLDATSRPLSSQWITSMVSNCDIGRTLVLGYSNYAKKAPTFQRFLRFHIEYRNLKETSSGSYGMVGNNLMFRKDIFLEGKGFQGNLKYIRGEYDFIVNKFARRGTATVGIDPKCFLEEIPPTLKSWEALNISYMETRQHMFRSAAHRLNFNLDMLFLHLGIWASFVLLIYSLATLRILAVFVALITLIGPLVIRALSLKKVFSQFEINDIPLKRGIIYEAYLIVHNVRYLIKYILADKADFISHKF